MKEEMVELKPTVQFNTGQNLPQAAVELLIVEVSEKETSRACVMEAKRQEGSTKAIIQEDGGREGRL